MVPPARAERILRWSLARAERDAVLGDMQEEFASIEQRGGVSAARFWYWRQAITSILPNAVRRMRNDERRAKAIRVGLCYMALGLLSTLVHQAWRHRPQDPSEDLLGVMWLSTGALGIVRALFAKRARLFKAQQKALTLLLVAIVVGVMMLSWAQELDDRTGLQLVWAFLLLFAGMNLWPWWPRDPAPLPPVEFAVRRKAACDEDRRKWLPVAVPNEPLGMSGLVLSAAAGTEDPSPPVRLGALTLRRKFTSGEIVRVYAALNGVESGAHAAVELIDTTGQIVRTIPAAVSTTGLERVFRKSDEDEDETPTREPEHFGEVDVRLRLADFAPGPYRVRLTVHDGAQSSVQQDGFVVQPD
jgi:PAS domain-containing protein